MKNSKEPVMAPKERSQQNSQNEKKNLSAQNSAESVLESLVGIPGINFEAFDAAAKGLIPWYRDLPDEKKNHIFKYRKLFTYTGI